MRLVVTTEQRFDQTRDGSVWAPGTFGYGFWERYLEVFDQVVVIARVRTVEGATGNPVRSDGQSVDFVRVPYYVGPWEYLRSRSRLVHVMQGAVRENAAVIMRVPSPIASTIYPALCKERQPYGLEVIGDPQEVFAVGAVRHSLRPFFRWIVSRQMRRQCRVACGAAYVTRETLQRRYPCLGYSMGVSESSLPLQTFVTSYSSIALDDSDFVGIPRPGKSGKGMNLVSVGSLEQMYKGPDVLIDAVRRIAQDGVDARLVWLGDGKYRRSLEARCAELGLDRRVSFRGHRPAGDAVRGELDKADLFVLASRTEGLPRAMIEAMARGLPCIGSDVGGIPELLPPEDLVPPGSAEALAAKIREVVTSPERMARMSARNLATAKEYREEVLRERRIAFYRHVKEQTEAWIRAKERR